VLGPASVPAAKIVSVGGGCTPAEVPIPRQANSAFAKEVGNRAPVFREGEIVAVNQFGRAWRFDEHSTGQLRAEIDAAGSLPLYRRALESSERVLGPEHPNTLTSVNNLAGCLRALGDAAGALPLYRRAADGFDGLFGPDHPSSRTVRANCNLLEREIAGQITRQTSAEKGEMISGVKSWWRRLFG
jgi:hypothetical protein